MSIPYPGYHEQYLTEKGQFTPYFVTADKAPGLPRSTKCRSDQMHFPWMGWDMGYEERLKQVQEAAEIAEMKARELLDSAPRGRAKQRIVENKDEGGQDGGKQVELLLTPPVGLTDAEKLRWRLLIRGREEVNKRDPHSVRASRELRKLQRLAGLRERAISEEDMQDLLDAFFDNLSC
ncbi:hypothetical protein MMC21_002828 [Puttea exsequens]|nr:hypothetical protein [Puttea exsequens]